MLDHCNALLYDLPKIPISPLQHLKYSAVRSITGARKSEHITPLLQKLHWLPITSRIEYKILELAYKALPGNGSEYIKELLVVHP